MLHKQRTRRDLFRLGVRSVAGLGLAGTFGRFGAMNLMAQNNSSYQALVCVFLFGGNDSNNMIVPLDSTRYNQYSSIRAGLAQTQSSLLPVQSQSDNNPYGFHSAMPEMQQLFSRKQLAVVANVGMLVQPTTRTQYQQASGSQVPMNLFSHLDQQNQWQTGLANSAAQYGWAGRVSDLMKSYNTGSFPIACSVSGNALMLNGQMTFPAATNPGGASTLTGNFGTAADNARDNALLQQILTFDSGFSLIQSANNQMKNGIQASALLNNVLVNTPALQTQFPATALGGQLQQVASIINARTGLGTQRQIFFASLDGFDTHNTQLTDQPPLLQQVSQALNAFYSATVEMGIANQVTTFTESEFARTFQPSSGGGSDHGWGGHHLVMGGAVKGGGIYGTFPTFELAGPSDANDRGLWIPTTSMDQYGATLASWFGLPSSSLATVFPNLNNFSTPNLGFLG